MNINSSYRSPNFTDRQIPVEFVVLHFTAGSLQRTLEIFLDPKREVSSHIVIDTDGAVYEVVPCFDGQPLRAWHAGVSRLEANGSVREGFNDFSLGIELVNLNGNIFPYTEAQYSSLCAVMERLKGCYPALASPEAVVGHEQVAGFRGKCDPGRCFEWQRFFALCYPGQGAPRREPLCSAEVAASLQGMVDSAGVQYDPKTGLATLPQGVDHTFFNGLSKLSEDLLSKKA